MNAQHVAVNKTPVRIALLVILSVLAVLIAAVFLVGCTTAKVVTPDPAAESSVIEDPTQTPPMPVFTEEFGATYTWDSGISISISEPAPYTPTEFAAGVVEGQQNLAFKIVLTNNSDEPFEWFGQESLASGGQEASAIFDGSHSEFGDVGSAPMTSVLPGQTIEWFVGYSVLDPSSLTFEITPDVLYDNAIFTNILP